MKGEQRVIEFLNKALRAELTAVNQFFLHARMLENWGLMKLGAYEYQESIGEMKHADQLIKRILFLDGLPNLQDLEKLRIGENVPELLKCDLELEYDARALYKAATECCIEMKDHVSRVLFETILASEEEHIDFLETQLDLIQRIGAENYQLGQMGDGGQGGGAN